MGLPQQHQWGNWIEVALGNVGSVLRKIIFVWLISLSSSVRVIFLAANFRCHDSGRIHFPPSTALWNVCNFRRGEGKDYPPDFNVPFDFPNGVFRGIQRQFISSLSRSRSIMLLNTLKGKFPHIYLIKSFSISLDFFIQVLKLPIRNFLGRKGEGLQADIEFYFRFCSRGGLTENFFPLPGIELENIGWGQVYRFYLPVQ